MTFRTRFAGFGLMAVLLLPEAGHAALQAASPQSSPDGSEWIARGGGGRAGGGRSGGGGSRGAGSRPGGSRGGGDRSRAQTGFQGASSGLNRGDRRPSGGWSNSVPASGARPSLDRPGSRDAARGPARDGNALGNRGVNQPAGREFGNGRSGSAGSRDLNRGDLNRAGINRDGSREFSRDGNRELNRDLNRTVNRNWTRNVNIGDVDIHPGWARPGWGVARPWNWGWYGGWSNPPWGWWGARAAVWGIGTLATAAVINDAVDAAINNQVSTIVVPSTSYQLLYGTVTPTQGSSVSFVVSVDGNSYQLTADCQAGTINGQDPASAAEAELLNAACQVAFGST